MPRQPGLCLTSAFNLLVGLLHSKNKNPVPQRSRAHFSCRRMQKEDASTIRLLRANGTPAYFVALFFGLVYLLLGPDVLALGP